MKKGLACQFNIKEKKLKTVRMKQEMHAEGKITVPDLVYTSSSFVYNGAEGALSSPNFLILISP